jgi:hypothetical protein
MFDEHNRRVRMAVVGAHAPVVAGIIGNVR